MPPAKKASTSSKKAETKLTKAETKLRAAFAKFDLNGDGVLTLPELRTVLTRPGGGQPMAEEQIQKLFKTMDVDGDGKVNLDEFSKALTSGVAKALVDPVDALDFEYSTRMLLMPFLRFKEQGRIEKSIKTWRDKALSQGLLVEYDKASGKIVIFVSHTWWDREFKDKTNHPDDPYDKGAPDYQADYPDEEREDTYGEVKTYQKPKDLKWRVICDGVETLIKEQGLKAEDVMLWVDWQSIYQDDKEEKLKGVGSLIKYATLSDYMLVPTDEDEDLDLASYPEDIPGYGSRGWCRVEYIIFSLASEMRGRTWEGVPGSGAQLYGIYRDGSLKQYPEVTVSSEESMPSRGALSNPNDTALVQGLEDTMIEVYGKVIVELKCKAGAGGEVRLQGKMIRACHVKALCEAVNKYEVKELQLSGNQLGDAGAEAIAAMLRTNRSLTYLELHRNKIGDAGKKALREAVEGREGFELVV